MTNLHPKLFLLLPALMIFAAVSCKKPAGPGGRAAVKGKVFSNDFDNTQQYMISSQYESGQKVFIVYGNSDVTGNNVTTSPDGSFEFLYLNKGHYKVFVNSLDTSIKVKGNKTMVPVIREFDITGMTQTVTLTDIVINK